MNKASHPHDEAAIEMLRDDPAFADEYLSARTKGLAAVAKRSTKVFIFVVES